MSRSLLALVLALPLAAAAQPRPDLQRGLVASYALDGDATDSVTRARGGAVATRAVDGHEGVPGTALWFDGTRSAVNLGPSLAPARFTLSAWIRPDAVDRPQAIVSKVRNLPGHWSKNFELRLDPGGRLFLHVPNGASWEGVAGTRPIPPGRWTHVAATYDGAVAQLWVDGVRDGAPLRSAYQQSSADVFIGARPENGGGTGRAPGGPDFFFRGAIDDVRIWDRPLGDAEIVLARNARLAPEPPPYAQPAPPAYSPPDGPDAPPAYRRSPPQPATLLAQFPLDGDARDAVGRADGTLFGTRPAEDRLGDPRGALAFSGKDHVSLGVRTEPEQISIAAWIRPARAQKEQAIFSKRSQPQAGRDRYLELGLDRNGRLVLALPNGSRFKATVASSQPLQSNRWVHVAATFDGERAALYLDGAPAGEAALDAYPTEPGPVLVGARPDAAGKRARPAQLFEGRIDDLRLYRGALSPDEVFTLARAEPEPPPDRGRGRGDDDAGDDLTLVRVDRILARYDAACARGDADALARVEARTVKELEEIERGFRGERAVSDRLRRAVAELRREGGETDAMALDRKRSAIFDLSDALWNDLVQEFDAGPARPRPVRY